MVLKKNKLLVIVSYDALHINVDVKIINILKVHNEN